MIHFLCKVDECLDFGILQITDYKLLEEYIKVEPNFPGLLDDDSNDSDNDELGNESKRKNEKGKKSKPNTDIKSTHNQSIKTDVLENHANLINSSILRTYASSINWRPKGIFYAKNEIFVDIIENVEFIYDLKTESVKRNEIYGSCIVKSYLSGIPVCRMGFNENYMSSIENDEIGIKSVDDDPLPENQIQTDGANEEGEGLLEENTAEQELEEQEEGEAKEVVVSPTEELQGEEVQRQSENENPTKEATKTFKHSIPIRNIQFHQCIELSKIYRDNIVTFIPPDDKFQLMSYQVEQQKNKKKFPLISIKPVFKIVHETKRLLVMCTLNTTFPRRRHCKSLFVRIPLNPYYFELDITDPNLKYKTENGEVSFKYDTMEIIWKIDSIDGKQTVRMMCELSLLNCEQVTLSKISHYLLRKMVNQDSNGSSVQKHIDEESEDARHDLEAFYGVNGKALTSTQKELLQQVKRNFKNDDIVLTFKIPMFTYSGLKLSYISVEEEQLKYPCFPWIRYLTQSSDLDNQDTSPLTQVMGQDCTYRFKLAIDLIWKLQLVSSRCPIVLLQRQQYNKNSVTKMSSDQVTKSPCTTTSPSSKAAALGTTTTKPNGNTSKLRTKSRNGCITCKKKRLKCDETKPTCLNCNKKSIVCGGYATNFKWKSFNESKPTINSKSLKKHLQLASFSVTGKSIEDIARESDLISKGMNPTESKEGTRRFSEASTATTTTTTATGPNQGPLFTRSYSDTYPLQDIQNFRLQNNPTTPSEAVVDEIAKSPIKEIDNEPHSFLSPSFENIMNPPALIKKNKEPEFNVSLTPSLSAILNFALNSEEIDVPSVETMSPLTLNRSYDLSSVPSPVCEFNKSLTKASEQEQLIYLYSQYTSGVMSIKNGFHENPWRNLIVPLATRYNCLFNSIAAMTLFHLAGSHGIVSSTEELRSRAQNYMKRCILELASGLSKMENGREVDFPADIALATCLNLAVSETWDVSTSSGIAHLKGAKSMINKILTLLKEHQESVRSKLLSGNGPDFSQGDFLQLKNKLVLIDQFEYEKMVHDCVTKRNSLVIPKPIQILFNTWIYFSVIAQMTTDTNYEEKGVDLVATITSMISNDKVKDEHDSPSPSEHSDASDKVYTFFEEFDAFNYGSEIIDPLLGCGQSLFCIIGKVAALVSKIRKTKASERWKKRNSLNTITQASELRHLLLDWKSTVNANMIKNEDEDASRTWDLPSCIATAEAYRYAALLFLHQAVPEIPSLSSHELAEKIFILLASIPKSSNTSVVHIFPLLVASCEAEVGEEREWCKARWKVLVDRMWIGNVDRALEVVKEVWKRKDELAMNHHNDASSANYVEDTSSSSYHHPLKGLMSVINNEYANFMNNSDSNGIESKVHWSNVMKEWGWEPFNAENTRMIRESEKKFSKPNFISFDLFGTIYKPKIPVPEQYHQITSQEYGISKSAESIEQDFPKVYAELQEEYPNYGKGTAEFDHSDAWWKELVIRVYGLPRNDSQTKEICDRLVNHFTSDEAYDVYDDVRPALDGLKKHGVTMVVSSNSDRRAIKILESLKLKDYFTGVNLSYDYEIGKPKKSFFDAVAVNEYRAEVNARYRGSTPPGDYLSGCWHVGDSHETDFIGSIRAGWNGILLDREGTSELSTGKKRQNKSTYDACYMTQGNAAAAEEDADAPLILANNRVVLSRLTQLLQLYKW
ncbi:hypothetical protein CANMA_004715 [Candida margitis]|uniref:uncharacterized protein n=1 Tax=Candida margitis TaxID=1775924 RepID=UPI0022274658|nr:uncharacterized protein CANMA_004715 [Candida margitis]KAI5953876.1 hypothetical protein CANMA_004715 [Candida margitis]